MLGEFAFAKQTREKAAVVPAFFQIDDKDAFQRRFGKFHLLGLPDYGSRVKTFSTIFAPMASEAVAAGDGALRTCRIPGPSSK